MKRIRIHLEQIQPFGVEFEIVSDGRGDIQPAIKIGHRIYAPMIKWYRLEEGSLGDTQVWHPITDEDSEFEYFEYEPEADEDYGGIIVETIDLEPGLQDQASRQLNKKKGNIRANNIQEALMGKRYLEISPELEQELREQKKRFIEKFGREPKPDDPLFIDPNSDSPEPVPYTEDRIRQVLADACKKAGFDDKKTNRFLKRFGFHVCAPKSGISKKS